MEHSSLAAHNVNDSTEVKVTVTVLLNATFSWLDKPTKNVAVTSIATGVVLCLIAVAAITINTCLIISIFSSSNLKRVILNRFVILVSLVCTLDCAINVPFSLFYVRNGYWNAGKAMCRTNSICVLLVSFGITWSICGMCIERWSSIFNLNLIKKCHSYCKFLLIFIVLLVSGSAIIIPIAFGLVETHAFPVRFSCFVAETGELYLRSIAITLFCLPVLLSSLCLLFALVRNFKDIKYLSVQRTDLSYAELFFEESNLWNEWRSCKFVGCIAVLYFAFELPFVLSLMEYNLTNTTLSNTMMLNSTSLTDSLFVQPTHYANRVYFWCKYCFCLIYPLITFALRRDIRRKFSVIMSLCKISSSMPNSTAQSTSPTEDNPNEFLVPQAWKRRRLSSVTCLTSPIIFAKSKQKNVQFQFTDLSSGIAMWKERYESHEKPSKRPLYRRGSTFFDDNFEDDEEFTEFMNYEDCTEEEINITDELTLFDKKDFYRGLHPIKDANETDIVKKQALVIFQESKAQNTTIEPVCRRISKSFNTHQSNTVIVKQRNYYMTYPKLNPNRINIQEYKNPSELLNALKSYRSKNFIPINEVFCRGTEELLDSPTENKTIVCL